MRREVNSAKRCPHCNDVLEEHYNEEAKILEQICGKCNYRREVFRPDESWASVPVWQRIEIYQKILIEAACELDSIYEEATEISFIILPKNEPNEPNEAPDPLFANIESLARAVRIRTAPLLEKIEVILKAIKGEQDSLHNLARIKKSDMLTLVEVAKETGLAIRTLQALCNNGAIPGAEFVGERLWMVPRYWVTQRNNKIEEPPEGYKPMAEVVRTFGVSRQAILHAIERGEIPYLTQTINERTKWFIKTDSPDFLSYIDRAQVWAEKTKKREKI